MKHLNKLLIFTITLLFSQTVFANSEIQIAKSDLIDMDCTLLEIAFDEASFIAEDAKEIDGENSHLVFEEESTKMKIFADEMQKRSCSKEFADQEAEKLETQAANHNPAVNSDI